MLAPMRTAADVEIHTVPHQQLTDQMLDQLKELFDREYFSEHGAWNPELPYGYAPHDVHLIARSGTALIGHVGWARRDIAVGPHELTVAGVGGVLVSPAGRGRRLGRRLMDAARRSMLDHDDIEFGYLGCDESVVPFYASCGWRRIAAPERWVDCEGNEAASPPGPPLLILPLRGRAEDWPEGEIDLRGRAW